MAPIAIRAANLTKHYTVPGRRAGLFRAKTPPTVFRAVEDVSFEIHPGERVAFIGPNGAGKSTTIKMLSGILTPTAGAIEVLGLIPTTDRTRLTYKIAAVFGQRSQLWLHLAVRESWEVLGHIYGTKISEQRARIKDLARRFNAEDLVDKPVKQLSLGERMRCELIACLLHRPQVIFLDEPTIGLDVEAKTMMRDLIKDMSVSEGTTVLLTSHDTGDMESVCERVLMINRGKLVLDESVALLRRRFVTDKVIVVTTTDRDVDWRGIDCQILEQKPHTTRLTIDATRGNISAVMQRILAHTGVQDIAVEDPPLENTIKRIYATTGQALAH